MKIYLKKCLQAIVLSFLFSFFALITLEAKVKIHSLKSPNGDLEL